MRGVLLTSLLLPAIAEEAQRPFRFRHHIQKQKKVQQHKHGHKREKPVKQHKKKGSPQQKPGQFQNLPAAFEKIPDVVFGAEFPVSCHDPNMILRQSNEEKMDTDMQNEILRHFDANTLSFAQKAVHLDGVYAGSLFREGDEIYSMTQLAEDNQPRTHEVKFQQMYGK